MSVASFPGKVRCLSPSLGSVMSGRAFWARHSLGGAVQPVAPGPRRQSSVRCTVQGGERRGGGCGLLSCRGWGRVVAVGVIRGLFLSCCVAGGLGGSGFAPRRWDGSRHSWVRTLACGGGCGTLGGGILGCVCAYRCPAFVWCDNLVVCPEVVVFVGVFSGRKCTNGA